MWLYQLQGSIVWRSASLLLFSPPASSSSPLPFSFPPLASPSTSLCCLASSFTHPHHRHRQPSCCLGLGRRHRCARGNVSGAFTPLALSTHTCPWPMCTQVPLALSTHTRSSAAPAPANRHCTIAATLSLPPASSRRTTTPSVQGRVVEGLPRSVHCRAPQIRGCCLDQHPSTLAVLVQTFWGHTSGKMNRGTVSDPS